MLMLSGSFCSQQNQFGGDLSASRLSCIAVQAYIMIGAGFAPVIKEGPCVTAHSSSVVLAHKAEITSAQS